MRCVNHTDRDAIAICNHCAKSICADCSVAIKSENYCKECVSLKVTPKKEERSPTLAAILSFVIAGTGQFYNGQIGKGIFFFFTSWLIIPWIIGMFDAYRTAKKINAGTIVATKRIGWLIAAVISAFIFWIFVFIVAILAAITIPLVLERRIAALETTAQTHLRLISAALENYSVDNNGNYPADEHTLLEAGSPYLSKAYNQVTISGYTFYEDLQPKSYKITATPQSCGVTGNKIFVIEAGGILSSYDCERPNESEGKISVESR
jgi:TM2 domain-containing membrane protein YozV/Tfp pilus assembly protein PilE